MLFTISSNIPNNSGKSLISNYPNPFVDRTTITYTTTGEHTLIQIMNTLGQLIATPLDTTIPAAGTSTLPLSMPHLGTGIYYARLQNGNIQQVKAMMKVR